jgi:hypothetical protein
VVSLFVISAAAAFIVALGEKALGIDLRRFNDNLEKQADAGNVWPGVVAFCIMPGPSWASSFGSPCGEWRGDIESAVVRWWPDLPVWRLWAAQLYAESRCDPGAVSPVGARGIAQIMPATGRDLARRLGVDPVH